MASVTAFRNSCAIVRITFETLFRRNFVHGRTQEPIQFGVPVPVMGRLDSRNPSVLTKFTSSILALLFELGLLEELSRQKLSRILPCVYVVEIHPTFQIVASLEHTGGSKNICSFSVTKSNRSTWNCYPRARDGAGKAIAVIIS
jgi:hypothetical protein